MKPADGDWRLASGQTKTRFYADQQPIASSQSPTS
jgi:hypothetical protein